MPGNVRVFVFVEWVIFDWNIDAVASIGRMPFAKCQMPIRPPPARIGCGGNTTPGY